MQGNAAEAESLARSAIEFQHDYADAHLLLAQLRHRRGAHEDAADAYTLAACFAPSHAEPRVQHGLLCLELGDQPQAEALLREALELDPGSARAHNAMGALLVAAERLDEARSSFERALERDPALADAHTNLGYLLYRDFEELERGEAHIRRALELAPDNLTALTNLTVVLREPPQEVIRLADGLLARDASLDSVRLNRGLALLKLGEFERGWQDYEARKSTRCNYVARTMPWPEWDGGALDGRGIYVHTEQGLGDEIMFASCLPEIAAAARKCVVECSPKLHKLFTRSLGAQIVVKPESDAHVTALAGDGIDCYSALGSVPRFSRRTIDDFPAHRGYLRADDASVARWRERLEALPGKLKVGIAWRGGMPSTQRSLRSTRLEQWLPLLAVPGVDIIDLQHFDSAEELREVRERHSFVVHRWEDAHDDYDQTAALVAALDLVISVQTAVVHLSGALGKEAWALISDKPEWRYLGEGERMPWYPSVRLLRKQAGQGWEELLRATAARVSERVPSGR